MEIRLLLDSEKQGRETPLSLGVYLIGRSRSCQIRPKSKSVSRKHCAIIHKPDVVLLQDIGSKHGTFVNEERLEMGVAAELADGDRIRAGRVRFRIAILADTSVKKPSKDAEANRRPKEERPEGTTSEKTSEKAAGQLEKQSAGQPVEKTAKQQAEQTKVKKPAARHSKPAMAASSAAPLGADVRDPKANNTDLASARDDGRDSDDQPHHVIDDIMSLIDVDASDVENSAIDMAFAANSQVDLEDGNDEADEVEFAAPRSNESLSEDQAVPSYELRQDWDVNSVQNYVSRKNAPPTVPTKKFKLKNASKSQKAEERERQKKIRRINGEPERNMPPWLERIESGMAGPILIVLFGIALIGWVAYNVYLLYSFDG